MLTIRIGEHLAFEGRVYGSVGIEYRVECDETAFKVEYSRRYLHPEKMPFCDGADEAIATYRLTPLRVGRFDVYEVEGFRGEETSRVRYVVNVVPDNMDGDACRSL